MNLLFLPVAALAGSFSDQTAAAGIVASHFPAYAATTTYAAGGTVGDFDNDGYPDIFVLTGGGGPDQLLMNQGDGTFVDEAAAWGVGVSHRGTGAVAGDVDGNGFLDLFVTSFGPARASQTGFHKLYLNQGNGRFVDMAYGWGVNDLGVVDGYGGALGDYDRDGDLDLVAAAYITGRNRLYRNDGDHFTDVTSLLSNSHTIAGFSPRFVDMDADGWPELIFIGDFGSSRYYDNVGGVFVDRTHQSGIGRDGSEMGIAVGDLDEDGRFDFYVTTIGTNNLHINRGRHQFFNFAGMAGVVSAGWAWGTVALDLDHDTFLDLVVASQAQRIYAFESTAPFPGQLAFQEVASSSGLLSTASGRAVSALDYDLDGDQDLVFFPFGGDVQLFRNDVTGPDAHWLTVRLDRADRRGVAPDGVGSRVLVSAGGRTWMRQIDAGSSYLSNTELVAHFRLGPHDTVDEVRVQWSDGSATVLDDVAADQHLTLTPRGLVQSADALGLLTVNGELGGPERRVVVAAGSRMAVAVQAGPTGPAAPGYAVYGMRGVPERADARDVDGVALAFPRCRPGPARTFLVASSWPEACAPMNAASTAPELLWVQAPSQPTTFTLQAVVEGPNGPRAANGVLVEVR
jgi:hypothetical protein